MYFTCLFRRIQKLLCRLFYHWFRGRIGTCKNQTASIYMYHIRVRTNICMDIMWIVTLPITMCFILETPLLMHNAIFQKRWASTTPDLEANSSNLSVFYYMYIQFKDSCMHCKAHRRRKFYVLLLIINIKRVSDLVNNWNVQNIKITNDNAYIYNYLK